MLDVEAVLPGGDDSELRGIRIQLQTIRAQLDGIQVAVAHQKDGHTTSSKSVDANDANS